MYHKFVNWSTPSGKQSDRSKFACCVGVDVFVDIFTSTQLKICVMVCHFDELSIWLKISL